ncbi:uncharacterized protein [Epargyreus clarus]|uniref:uncharacterized protein isoform X2 n=1 Tax=Epargyreus clarus TaxID=520877 RepID=UPI003C2F9BE2
MAPMFGSPNFDFLNERDSSDDLTVDSGPGEINATQMAFWYMIVLVSMLLLWLLMFFCLRLIALRQKTRNPQQRRQYMGARPRPSLAPAEPTIYVSPANLPPPPKYEALAPPSYEEVVGIHYPGYQAHVQPITQPITAAMAQCTDSSQNSGSSNSSNENNVAPATVITVTADSRTSVTATS